MNRRTSIPTIGLVALAAACTATAPRTSPSIGGTPGPRAGGPTASPLPPGVVVPLGPLPAAPIAATDASAPWSNVPDAKGELFSVLDGTCPHLGVDVLENEAFIRYGSTVARPTADAITIDPALSSYGSEIEALEGRYPDQLYARVAAGYRCSYVPKAVRFVTGAWKPAFALPTDIGVFRMRAYGSGAIGIRNCGANCGGPPTNDCVEGPLMGDNAKAPPIAGDGYKTDAYEVLPSGEIYAVGDVCRGTGTDEKCVAQFRWWAPGGKVAYAPMGAGRSGSHWDGGTRIVARSKSEVYVISSDYFGVFDGSKLTKIKSPGKAHGFLADAADGSIWLKADDKLWRRKADASFEDISPPVGGEPVGVKTGSPWVVGGGSVYKYVQGAWQKVPLPPPPFASSSTSYLTPESVHMRTPDDVFVIASYHEMPRGWKEAARRHTLLRTKRPKETVRCDVGAGLRPWPAPATESCKTPFLLLASVSAESPKNFDYPQTRVVMRPKVEQIVDGALAEIRENGTTWIGLVPRTLAEGRGLLELYASRFDMTTPSLVCAQPTITRKIPIR